LKSIHEDFIEECATTIVGKSFELMTAPNSLAEEPQEDHTLGLCGWERPSDRLPGYQFSCTHSRVKHPTEELGEGMAEL